MKCGNPATDHGTIATNHDSTDAVGLRIAAPEDDQTPHVPGEIFGVHQNSKFGIF